MNARRRRFKQLIRSVARTNPASAEELCGAVAEHLGRSIRLLAMPLPADAPCGLALSTAEGHYIVYDNTTTPMHQRHIIGHELGHLIAGHASDKALDTDVSRLLMPTLDPAVVQRVLARAMGYDRSAEREAETIADLIWRHTNAWTAEPSWTVDPAAAEVINRMRQSLTGE